MSKFAMPGSLTPTRSAQRNRAARLDTTRSVVTSTVPVVTAASTTANTRNRAGGVAFSPSDKMEFVTACLSWAMLRRKDSGGSCYETEAARFERIKNLVPRVGAEFAAKTALMIRIMDGGRTISHALAAFIAPHASGEPWAEDFYYQIAVRPDDMCEITAAIWKWNGQPRANQDTPGLIKKKLPRALVRGFARRFQRFDEYRLAKYANKSANPSLKQLIQLVRPAPLNKEQYVVFQKLLTDKLVNTDTWEAKLSATGQAGGSRGEAWAELVAGQKLGPLALLKNLRNLATHCTGDVIDEACAQLCDAQTVKNCGILPAQYLTAYSALAGIPQGAKLKAAIDQSVDIASGNIPALGKSVLVAIDESGSMRSSRLTESAAIFAASLIKSNPNVDVMYFATDARYAQFNRKLPIMELIKEIVDKTGHGSTNFNSIFNRSTKAYDTVVILSDSEGWMGQGFGSGFRNRTEEHENGAPTRSRQAYASRFGVNPTVFSFDLGGDGSLMFREDSIITLAGNSFLVFKLLSYLKQERSKLVDIVDTVEIGKPMPTFGEEED